MKKIRKSLTLSEQQWKVLDDLARQTNSLVTKTKWQGRFSWRKMIERLSNNDLAIEQSRRKRVSSLLADIKANIKALEE